MQDIRKWIEKYKQLCVMLGILGLLLSPFLWPFFLAILLNSLSLALPVLVVWIIVNWKKEKKNENNRDKRGKNSENGNKNAAEDVSKNCKEGKDNAEEDSISRRGQKRTEPVTKKREMKSEVMDAETCAALSWYQMEGRERILRLMKRLESDGIYAFSVTPEGICTVREEKRFRRVGILRAFPRHRVRVIEREIRKEGIRTSTKGKYLWLFWGKKV